MTQILDVVGVRPGTRIRFRVEHPPDAVSVYSINTQAFSAQRTDDLDRWLPEELEQEGGTLVVEGGASSYSVLLAVLMEDSAPEVTLNVLVDYQPAPPPDESYAIPLLESVSAYQWVFIVTPRENVN
ncbi:MAG TPA: hypothetical protein VE974_14355 [Thermoanaerobaculia bacterium]|nr:hypothetical protein [Thermoanaerobaculia bacterium]